MILQRIINGGGDVRREYAVDRKRIDLLVLWKNQRIVIELKIFRDKDSRANGLAQIAKYCELTGAHEAHLVLFDRNAAKPPNERISYSLEKINSLTVHVWTL